MDKSFLASHRGCQQAHVSNMHGLINAPVSSASLSDTSPSFNSTMGFLTSFSSPFLPSSSWEVPVEDCSAQAVVLEEGYVPSIHCETTCTGSLPSDLDFRESEGQSGMTKNAGPNACLRSFRSKQLNQSFQQSTDQNNLEDLLNYKSTTRMTDTMHSKKDELGNGDRACTIGPSLRCVLSDPITGSLLDDAMVSICGHSFGGAGLQRVIETGTCLSCGASISSGSLFPNHALREAVDAYKREECYRHMTSKDLKRRRENLEVLEDVEGKKMNMDCFVYSGTENSFKPRVEFPFSINDHVLIKGNRRTPERFVGREAVITTQCLNGWYLVRTLDNGESVRLQYRSLQKLNAPVALEHRGSLFPKQQVDTGRIASAKHCTKNDSPPHKPVNDNTLDTTCLSNKREKSAFSIVSMPVKSFKTNFSCETNRRAEKENLVNDSQAVSAITSAITSSNSSQELSVDQLQSVPRCSINNLEHSHLCESNAVYVLDDLNNADSVAKNAIKGGFEGTITQSDTFMSKMKRSALNTKISSLTQETAGLAPDPYRKIYPSASRRRGSLGNSHAICSSENLHSNKLEPIYSERAANAKASTIINAVEGEPTFKGLHMEDPTKVLQTIKKDIMKFERYIPRSCFHWSWGQHRLTWRNYIRKSSTIKELATQLGKLHASLLISLVSEGPINLLGNGAAHSCGFSDLQLLVHLWKKLYDDMHKWLKEKHQDMKGTSVLYIREQKGLNTMFPEIFTDSTSPELAGVSSKFIHQQSDDKLAMIRETLERERRYTIAKLAQLEANSCSGAHIEDKEVFDKEPLAAVSIVENFNPCLQLSGLQSAMIVPLHQNINKNTRFDYVAKKYMSLSRVENFSGGVGPSRTNQHEEIIQTVDTNGESTDMSDSD